MTQRRQTCKQCDKPLRVTKGRGRPRVYCSPACRNVAYEDRRASRPPAEVAGVTGRPSMTVDGLDQRRAWTACCEPQACIDQVLDSPKAAQDFMDQFLCRTAMGLILEDLRYQGAVNGLVTTYRMIHRITRGDFRLPAVRV